jgi:hypothetical protein
MKVFQKLLIAASLLFVTPALAEHGCDSLGEIRLQVDAFRASKAAEAEIKTIDVTDVAQVQAFIAAVRAVNSKYEMDADKKAVALLLVVMPNGNTVAYVIHEGEQVCNYAMLSPDLFAKAMDGLRAAVSGTKF